MVRREYLFCTLRFRFLCDFHFFFVRRCTMCVRRLCVIFVISTLFLHQLDRFSFLVLVLIRTLFDYWCVSGRVEGSFSTLRVQFLSEFRFFCVNRCNICMCKFFWHFCEFCLFFVPAKSTFVVLRVKPLPFGLVVHRFCSSVARFCPRFWQF